MTDEQTYRLHRSQGQTPFRAGDIVAKLLDDVPDGAVTYERADGAVLTMLRVERASSLSDYDVEEFDAWSHQHEATCVLATTEEATPLIERWRAERAEREAEQRKKSAEIAAYEQAVEEAKMLGQKCTAYQHLPEHERTGEPVVNRHVHGRNRVQRIVFADGREGALHSYGNATVVYCPADLARDARIAYAVEAGITKAKALDYLEKYSGCYGADVHRAVVNDATDDELAEIERAAEALRVLERVRDAHSSLMSFARGAEKRERDASVEPVTLRFPQPGRAGFEFEIVGGLAFRGDVTLSDDAAARALAEQLQGDHDLLRELVPGWFDAS